MATLECSSERLGGIVESVPCPTGHYLQAQLICAVLVLLFGPLSILLIQRGPVIVDIFIQFHVTDLKIGPQTHKEAIEGASKDLIECQNDKQGEKGPSWRIKEVTSEEVGQGMFRQVSICHSIFGDQMVIRKHLLVGGHPVAEAQKEERRIAHLVQHRLAQPLIIHRWQSVAIVQHGFLNDVKDEKGHCGDRE